MEDKLLAEMHMNNITILDPGEPFVCLFSGGKDSGLALSLALESGRHVENLMIYKNEDNTSLHHKQNRKFIEKQSASMGMSISFIPEEDNLLNYYTKLSRACRAYAKQGVRSLVMGFVYDTEAAYNHFQICSKAGLTLKLPLWGKSDEDLLNEIEKRSIKSIISTIDEAVISTDWLGKIYDRKAYNYFRSVGINPMGEAGEFHTTLIYADFFKYPLNYSLGVTEDNAEISMF